jgi:hypothetical protein
VRPGRRLQRLDMQAAQLGIIPPLPPPSLCVIAQGRPVCSRRPSPRRLRSSK